MTHLATSDTARRLKEAGFPQPGYPAPETKHILGRFFYNHEGYLYYGTWREGDDEDAQKDANGETIEVIQICVYT